MGTIDKIKADLTKISKWPWRIHWGNKYPRVKDANGAFVLEAGCSINNSADAYFIALSPSCIALLVEYFEAAEGELKYLGTSGDTLMYRRLKEARARLEEKDE